MITYTTNLGLAKPVTADPTVKNSWGIILDTNADELDQAIAGLLAVDVTTLAGYPNVALTSIQGAIDQSKNRIYLFSGVLTQNCIIFWPKGLSRAFTVANNTTGAFTLTLAVNSGSLSAAGGSFVLPQGQSLGFYSDGTNVAVENSALGQAPAQITGVPTGTLLDFAGGAAPTGFLFADGSAYASATYPALFNVIGTTFNTGGEGAGIFRVPDTRGRVTAGVDAGAGRLGSGATNGITGSATMGATGGEQSHTLLTGELAAHTHNNTLNDPGHAHGVPGAQNAGGGSAQVNLNGAAPSAENTTTVVTNITLTNASVGSSTPHNVVQPTIVLAKIIKT